MTDIPCWRTMQARHRAQRAEKALLDLHKSLFPERYGSGIPMYEWDAGTIEHVAGDLERALAACSISGARLEAGPDAIQ